MKASNDAVLRYMNMGKMCDYFLNDDKAKKQLLNSAKRTNLTVTKKTKKSTKISVCTGTYKEVVYPMLDKWSSLDLTAGGALLDPSPRMEVRLLELRHDNESSLKCTQSVAEINFKGKVKVHLYHTNQTILIQGDSHEEFYSKFLSPILTEVSHLTADKIRRFNSLIINSMKSGPRFPDPGAPSRPRAGVTRAGARRPSDTARPASGAVSSAVSILNEILEMSGIPNTSQDISLTNPEQPALAQ